MTPYFSKKVDLDFDSAIQKVTELLKSYGFGIITQVDVKETLKNKIDIDFRPYRILGACNPKFAHKALTTFDKVGIMMPCNVVVQQHEDGTTEITLINPETMVKNMPGSGLEDFACEVTEVMRKVFKRL
jgi:uncharacterized protein (DUF302 family)